MKKVTAFSINPSVIEAIDLARGRRSRSEYVEELLRTGLGLRGFELAEGEVC